MDVDLSTDLAGLLPLVAPLVSGHSDLAIGTRRARGSRVVRGPKREFISRCYNLLLRGDAAHRGSATPSAASRPSAPTSRRELLPLVQDDAWFFDTEMLVLAERAGMRIHEVPVDWVDDPDSRVDIVATALADLRGIARVRRDLARGTLGERLETLRRTTRRPDGLGRARCVRFAAIGVLSTLALRRALPAAARRRHGRAGGQRPGAAWSPPSATPRPTGASPSASAAAATGCATSSRASACSSLGLALTSGALAPLHLITATPPRTLEVTVLVARQRRRHPGALPAPARLGLRPRARRRRGRGGAEPGMSTGTLHRSTRPARPWAACSP